MPKFSVTFERVRYYTVEVSAADADAAGEAAERRIAEDGTDVYYTASSKVELIDVVEVA
jgi:hypothetical protein